MWRWRRNYFHTESDFQIAQLCSLKELESLLESQTEESQTIDGKAISIDSILISLDIWAMSLSCWVQLNPTFRCSFRLAQLSSQRPITRNINRRRKRGDDRRRVWGIAQKAKTICKIACNGAEAEFNLFRVFSTIPPRTYSRLCFNLKLVVYIGDLFLQSRTFDVDRKIDKDILPACVCEWLRSQWRRKSENSSRNSSKDL